MFLFPSELYVIDKEYIFWYIFYKQFMIFKPARRIYEWGAQKANSPFAPFWLGVIFLLEAVLFLPLDALLMLFCMENPERRFTYALVATGVSVLTAFLGYCVGFLLWDAVGGFITT